ncbi:hypothetical protein [Longimicrobium terrae]|uniref:Carboxypeptidase regulatory-like domain-containing protein n=1 Tax=Longimicrobium terrae TaxID=1639882 RepID=A0A841GVF7_9BACT|nr:hypothetical protein [Longimicrobium terrae]MBB4635284.1 hypothetical protein [Longimicrobium terrae]MBB6069678.1 hypothetical protein [Longimicrobium terrae]NNC31111.1 hypothetical protein [Longimicrobium terrae]
MQYVYGLTVHVRSAGQAAPAALTVIASEGAWADTLKPQEGSDSPGGSNPASFVGVGERAGTYTVTATAPGHRPASRSGVVITHDGCHVRPVSLTLQLERQ